MKKSLIVASLLAGFAFAGSASASSLSYNYVEAGYSHTSVDDGIDTNGIGVNGSWSLGRNFQVIGGFSAAEGDEYGVDQDIQSWNLGFGYAYPIGGSTALHLRALYDYSENDLTAADFNGAGRLKGTLEAQSTVAELGLRHAFNSRFEGWVYGGYTKIEEFKLTDVTLDGVGIDADTDLTTSLSDDESTYGRIGGLFKINSMWGVGGEVKADKDFTSYTIGVRASF